jgi:type VI protein secretion system component VasK
VTGALSPGLPVALVATLSVLALTVAAAPTTAVRTKRLRLTAIAIVSALALATTVWQAWAAGEQIARFKRDDRSKELASQVKTLEAQVAKLKEGARARSLGADTAGKLADYLRPFGSRKVVVSCAPNDI